MKERLSGFGRAVFFSFCVKKKGRKRKTAIGWGMAGGCLCVGKVAGATWNKVEFVYVRRGTLCFLPLACGAARSAMG